MSTIFYLHLVFSVCVSAAMTPTSSTAMASTTSAAGTITSRPDTMHTPWCSLRIIRDTQATQFLNNEPIYSYCMSAVLRTYCNMPTPLLSIIAMYTSGTYHATEQECKDVHNVRLPVTIEHYSRQFTSELSLTIPANTISFLMKAHVRQSSQTVQLYPAYENAQAKLLYRRHEENGVKIIYKGHAVHTKSLSLNPLQSVAIIPTWVILIYQDSTAQPSIYVPYPGSASAYTTSVISPRPLSRMFRRAGPFTE